MLEKLGPLFTITVLLISTTFAQAVEVQNNKPDSILQVETNESETENQTSFTLGELEKLPGRIARVKTPWFDGHMEFSGPYLREVIAAAGIDSGTIRITALNDYEVEFPVSDAKQFDVILATRMNGKPMSVREKGPLFVIYPFDKRPELYTEKYFNRSVWQVKSIRVAP